MPAIRDADDATMVRAMLDWYREGVRGKALGMSPRDAVRSPLQSGTTVAGLVKHLAMVEDWWFSHCFAGQPMPEPWASGRFDEDPDWEFHSAVEDELTELVTMYDAACERSRQVAAAHTIDDHSIGSARGDFTLRWALVHLLEETARHLGHIDVLREFFDGSTGE